MKLYEVPAFLRIYANSSEEASNKARETAEAVSASGDVTLGTEGTVEEVEDE